MSREFQIALSFAFSFILSRIVYKLVHPGPVVQHGAFWGVGVRLALWALLFVLSYFLVRFLSRPKPHRTEH